MILLGLDIGDLDPYGCNWRHRINDWIKDQTWDLSGIFDDMEFYNSENILPILDSFQALAEVTGATNIEQVEYFFRLELRLKALEEKLKEL